MITNAELLNQDLSATKLPDNLLTAALDSLRNGISSPVFTVLMSGDEQDRRLEIWDGHIPDRATFVVTRPGEVIAKFDNTGNKIS